MLGADKGKAGRLDGKGLYIGVVQARFNEGVTEALEQACRAELGALGVAQDHIDLVRVPGALEVPIALQAMAEKGGYDALIALGCVIPTENMEQAVARQSDKGRDAARVAVEMCHLLDGL
jgi:6,7-dimethyl-8-ribityllumazine synthase